MPIRHSRVAFSPRHVHALSHPIFPIHLRHHKIRHIFSRNLPPSPWQSLSIHPDPPHPSPFLIHQHRRHHHGEVEPTRRQRLPLRNLRRHRPLQERVVYNL